MNIRNKGTLLAPLIGAIALFATACSGGGTVIDVRATEVASQELRAIVAVDPYTKPNMFLLDTNGKPFDIVKDTEGKLTIFYIGYTFCPDICPTTMSDISVALASLSDEQREQVAVVFVTADPARDTPEVLRKWLDGFDESFIGLIPTERQLDQLTAMLNMAPIETTKKTDKYYTVSHAAFAIAFDGGDTGRYLYPWDFSVGDWKHDLPLLIQGVNS
jgi:protein SCO1/2